VRRVCTEREQEFLRESSEPELLLWCYWASKETAFKLISKIDHPPTFIHKKFECMQLSLRKKHSEVCVKYGDHVMRIHLNKTPDWLHAIGHFDSTEIRLSGDAGAARVSKAKKWELSNWRSLFTERELSAITRFESAFVRLRCKQALAKRFGFEIRDLEIIRPVVNHQSMAPYLLVNGERSDIDISLSHHGDWAGWAYCQAAS
jgi:phosphopantetheinyl transferase (holo-ACP synthase)